MTEIPHYKRVEDYSPDEHAKRKQADRQGETFRVETDEYKQARAEALADAGLEDTETRLEDKPREQWTTQDHIDSMRRNNQ